MTDKYRNKYPLHDISQRNTIKFHTVANCYCIVQAAVCTITQQQKTVLSLSFQSSPVVAVLCPNQLALQKVTLLPWQPAPPPVCIPWHTPGNFSLGTPSSVPATCYLAWLPIRLHSTLSWVSGNPARFSGNTTAKAALVKCDLAGLPTDFFLEQRTLYSQLLRHSIFRIKW